VTRTLFSVGRPREAVARLTLGYSPNSSDYRKTVVHYWYFESTYLKNGWEFGDETYMPGKLCSRCVLGARQIRISLRPSRTPYSFSKRSRMSKKSSTLLKGA